MIRDAGNVAEGYMRLAQYYESKFGRHALERLVVRELSDSEFEPGDLHQSILNLPWREVFTTNWDTLLERAALRLSERTYFPVANDKDLLTAGRPRITKLHGCVERNQAFIFTEEDYRAFPTKHPAFLTTVRQALLEGPLCLIGFSGDDPNFRAWLGWIRDVFGAGHPIYLIELLPKASQDFQTKRLQEQGITQLCLGRKDASGNPVAPEAVLTEFIEYLKSFGERSWPKVISTQDWVKVAASYPGWLICPFRYRSMLRRRLANPRLEELGVDQLAARMHLWRLVGTGPWGEELDHIDSVIDQIGNKQPDTISIAQKSEMATLILERIDEAHLAGNFDRCEMLLKLLDSYSLNDAQRARLELSTALVELKMFRFESLKARLESFRSSDPAHSLRALALRLEQFPQVDITGEIERLETQIRRLVRANPASERATSLDVALDMLKDRNEFVRLRLRGELFSPLNSNENVALDQRARNLECDIGQEVLISDAEAGAEIIAPAHGVTRRRGFAPNTLNESLQVASLPKQGMISAYLVARMWDDAGLFTGNAFVDASTDSMTRAAQWLLQFDVPQGFALVLRLAAFGAYEAVDKLLTRQVVCAIPERLAESAWESAFDALQRWTTGTLKPSKGQLRGLVLILRLVIRRSRPQAESQFQLLIKTGWQHSMSKLDEPLALTVQAMSEAGRVIGSESLGHPCCAFSKRCRRATELSVPG